MRGLHDLLCFALVGLFPSYKLFSFVGLITNEGVYRPNTYFISRIFIAFLNTFIHRGGKSLVLEV